MTQRRKQNEAGNAPSTGLHLVKNGQDNAALIPTRPPRLCACGCGESFVPSNNWHKYIDKHRQKRFIEDKKDATFEVFRALLIEHGASKKTARLKAQEIADFWFRRGCLCLERMNYKYVTKSCEWVKA